MLSRETAAFMGTAVYYTAKASSEQRLTRFLNLLIYSLCLGRRMMWMARMRL